VGSRQPVNHHHNQVVLLRLVLIDDYLPEEARDGHAQAEGNRVGEQEREQVREAERDVKRKSKDPDNHGESFA
jgi:hypothetical protein